MSRTMQVEEEREKLLQCTIGTVKSMTSEEGGAAELVLRNA